jgi:hypothetical protein
MNDFERIETATESALFEFWRVIAESFPEADSGDIDPLSNFQFNQEAEKIVSEWFNWNVAIKREEETK